MSNLLFLEDQDFFVAQGNNGQVLCNRVKGFCLVLFYSTACPHCKQYQTLWRQLPGTVRGCHFAMINVSTSKGVVAQSQNTIAPLKYVPFVVLYHDGRPYMRYNGPENAGEILRFITAVYDRMMHFPSTDENNQNPAQGQNIVQRQGKIPAFTIGIPLKGPNKDRRCYLDMGNAYKNGTQTTAPNPRVGPGGPGAQPSALGYAH